MPILLLLCLLSSLSACQRPDAAAPDYGRTPIVFVHGRGQSSRLFDDMRAHFRRRGYPASYLHAIDLEPDDAPNAFTARTQLAPFIEAALASANDELRRQRPDAPPHTRVDIIAHSMGSLSSRWYIAHIHPERVRTWISMAGPNHGSDPECPGTPGSGRIESCPAFARTPKQSALQLALNGTPEPDIDETPYGLGDDSPGVNRRPPDATRRILYVTFRLPVDEYIAPAESTVLDGAGGLTIIAPPSASIHQTSPGNFLVDADLGHDDLPCSAIAVWDLILEILVRPPETDRESLAPP